MSTEPESQTFLVRVWREDPSDGSAPLNFRGHICCLPDGARTYFQSWIEVQAYVNSHLEGATGNDAHALRLLKGTGEASRSQV